MLAYMYPFRQDPQSIVFFNPLPKFLQPAPPHIFSTPEIRGVNGFKSSWQIARLQQTSFEVLICVEYSGELERKTIEKWLTSYRTLSEATADSSFLWKWSELSEQANHDRFVCIYRESSLMYDLTYITRP